MAQILVPSKSIWTRQPDHLPRLDPALAPDAYFMPVNGLGSGIVEGESKIGATYVGSGHKPVVSEQGLGLLSASSSFIYQGLKSPLVDVGEVSLLAVVKPLSVTSTAAFIAGLTTQSSTQPLIGLGQGSSAGTLYFLVRADDGSVESTLLTPPSSEWANGKPAIIVATHSARNGYHRIYINGVRYQDVASTVSGATSTNRFNVGGLARTTNGSGVSARHYLAAMWKRALDDAEARALSENPWQIFARRDHRTIVDFSASGGSLNASASGHANADGSATLEAQVALAGVGVSVADGAAQAGVAVPLSAAGISVAGGSAHGVATVSISAAGLAQASGQAGLSAAVLLQAAGAAQAAGNATLAAQLNALASGAAQASGSANLSGGAPGALSASGGDVASGSAVLSISVQLQATGAAQAGGSANGEASAPGALSASGQANAAGFATWSALVTLTAAGFVQAMGAGSFQVSIPLAAAGAAHASGVAQATLGGLVNRFALQVREKRLTEAAASVWRIALVETNVARLTRMVHEVKHV